MSLLKIHSLNLDTSTSDYLILAGPTAVGKTDTVMQLARQCAIEVISGDSRQVYRHMDIGTATPDPDQLKRVPHHLINVLEPDVVWNAADFYQRARELIRQIIGRGALPVVVGGAGMYLDALRFGLFDEQSKDPILREKYQTLVDSGAAEGLWQELLRLDPDYVATFHYNNHKKLMRAFEIYESTGRIPSQIFSQSQDPFELKESFLVLDRPRPQLYARINARVQQMLDTGLIDECRQLQELGYAESLYPLRTIGYKEVFAHLRGELSLAEMTALIQKHTRNFAKRQLTWFRNHPFDHWIDLG